MVYSSIKVNIGGGGGGGEYVLKKVIIGFHKFIGH